MKVNYNDKFVKAEQVSEFRGGEGSVLCEREMRGTRNKVILYLLLHKKSWFP